MLEELRQKSKGTREAYAFWGALMVTGLVAVIWIASLPVRFSEVDTVASAEKSIQGDGAFSQFFGKIKENFRATWQQGQEALEGIKEEEKPEPPTSEPPTTTNTPTILISTTTEKSILIATTSRPN